MAFFYDADQHDQTYERVNVQVRVEQVQRRQRAESGRGSPDRMVADGCSFVQNAQHDVHHEDGHQQQQVSPSCLEGLGRTCQVV